MRFDVVTLFPEMLQAMIGDGVTGRAFDKGLADWSPGIPEITPAMCIVQ